VLVLLSVVVASYAAVPGPTKKPVPVPRVLKPPAVAPPSVRPKPVVAGTCPVGSKRRDYCRAQAHVPAGKWAVSHNAPWARGYLQCVNKCAAANPPVAKPRSFKSFFSGSLNRCKAGNKCKTSSHKGGKKYTSFPMLIENKAAHSALARQLSKALADRDLPNPIATIESMLVTLLRGVDLAEQVLDGHGKQIWDALACPACQCAVLQLYQTGCNKAAEAVCSGVAKAACGAAYQACNDVICPLIDPLFASECTKVIQSLQTFNPFTATVPFNVCKVIHMCKPADENLGTGLD